MDRLSWYIIGTMMLSALVCFWAFIVALWKEL